MSEQGRCPRADDLVLLLAGPRPGPRDLPEVHALRQHAAECSACGAELLSLEQGFAALGADPAPGADAAALHRIEGAVLRLVAADLSRAPGPRRLILSAALCFLGVAVATGLWSLLRGVPLLAPGRGMLLALLPVLLLPALRWGRGRQGLALLAAGVLAAGLLLSGTADRQVELWHGVFCLLLGAAGVAAPALVLWLALPGERQGTWSGALLGAAIGAGGIALQRSFCEVAGLPHALLFHLGPFLLTIAAAAWLGRWAARLPATRPA